MSDAFPSIAWCARLGGPKDDIARIVNTRRSQKDGHVDNVADRMLFDVKFWPWPDEEDEESIFAMTGGCDTFVCRTKQNADPPFDVLRWWREDYSYSLNSLCWTQDEAGNPLLCVAGSAPKSIVIYSIKENARIRTLPGHGRAINDLQISPISPFILASASEDYTIRLWNLSSTHKSQPCVALFSGQGHKQPLLTLAFHPCGNWLLSGGMDTAVALWPIPPIDSLLASPTSPDLEPQLISYPSFISEEVHTNYVDCVAWYGDAILSRAARGQTDKDARKNEILLWRIDGFDAEAPPPKNPPIPYPELYTRSGFPHDKLTRGFTRLLTFAIDSTPRFYLRFGLFHASGRRPMLVMGNEKSRFLFWDLQRCEEGEEVGSESSRGSGRGRGRGGRGRVSAENLSRLATAGAASSTGRRDGSVASESPSTLAPRRSSSQTPNPAHKLSASISASTSFPPPSTTTAAPPNASGGKRTTHLDDPFKPLKPHCERLADTALSSKQHFACAQVSWSVDGKWCVGVGDRGMICVLRR